MNFNLASQIFRGNWLISDEFVASAGPLVSKILDDKINLEQKELTHEMYSVIAAENGVKYSEASWWGPAKGWQDAAKGSVAVIPIKGALMKEDQACRPMGMSTIGKRIQEADTNKNIVGIVLDIDSPGGTVDGTETLGNIIRNCNTKTVAFVNGMMASAALWLGTSCDECVASTELDSIGSIGVLINFMDVQPYWEKLGVKFHMVTATQSPDKCKRFEMLREGKYDEYKTEVLDVICEKFISTVKTNCSGVTSEHLTGKMFFAKDVKGIFVSDIMTIDEAITLAGGETITHIEDGSDDPNSANDNSKKPNSIEMKQFKNVNTALDTETLESVDNSANLSEEQLEALDTSLAAGIKAQDDLTAEQAAHAETQTQLTQANEKIATLNGTPGASSKEVNKDTDIPEGDDNTGMQFLAKEDIEQFKNL